MKENEANNKDPNNEEVREKKSKIPHIFAILFIIIIVASLASYIIPAGEYERVTMEDGTEVIDPDTFEVVDRTSVGILDFMFSIPTGFIETAEVIFVILMIRCMFAVIERTVIINLGVRKLANTFSNLGLCVLPILIIPFSLITTFTCQIELSLVYLPAILPLMLI